MKTSKLRISEAFPQARPSVRLLYVSFPLAAVDAKPSCSESHAGGPTPGKVCA